VAVTWNRCMVRPAGNGGGQRMVHIRVGGSCGLRWHGVAAAERDGEVLGVDEDVDQRFPVGDPEVVPPRPGHGTDGGNDLPG
jgi:hypothetical protein